MTNPKHIYPIHEKLIQRGKKEKFLNQKGHVFWCTGLSGSGKSTIAAGVEKNLFSKGYLVKVLDGDNTRTGISKNLGFSLEDRQENIRRIAEISRLFVQSGIICINSFVSPTHEIRSMAKSIIGTEDFSLIYIEASLGECESRDVKGLYKKARQGEIKGFTGIDSPFDTPEKPGLIINTESLTVEESIIVLSNYIYTRIQLKR